LIFSSISVLHFALPCCATLDRYKLAKKMLNFIARGGVTRWHIENETFNTLKSQGYHFEHNFDRWNKNLSTALEKLMMLAFLIDKVALFAIKF